ncbi:hypothetical protein ISN45_At05g039560 [Arabidopsis thaliana x Arabidopsis arenosa]|uniref:Transmembrane protein n=1 Tax=Arabidopsis thaliana x Arabidopsis arenosa TaxID=1240361 RepID=A0A8T2D7A4_9BRAS|nr:hypothetical protein ISN45_At05g039560 [Arabidopsis thaliana x Arabidopsis arenosa]
MEKIFVSKLTQVFIVVLLCIFIYRTESAMSSHHEQLSLTGRRMMANTPYPYGGIYVKPPTSKCKYSNQKGKRWETYYKPNSEIGTGPSHSGHGGSSIEHVSSP